MNRLNDIDKLDITQAEKMKLRKQEIARIKTRFQLRFTILKLTEVDTPTAWIDTIKKSRGIYSASLWEKHGKRRIYMNFDQSIFSTNMRDAKVYFDLDDMEIHHFVKKSYFAKTGYFDESDYEIFRETIEDVHRDLNNELKEFKKGERTYQSGVTKTLHDKVSARIESGMKRGETFRETQLAIQRLVDEKFPTGKVSVFNVRDGVGRVWSQDSVNYTANWVRNQQTRFSSDAVIDAMDQVNADIVEYKLGANVEDHTEICTSLAAGSPYSLSGLSKKYPPLPQAPPASPPPHPCQSRIVPAPSKIQENYAMPSSRKEVLEP